MRCYNCWWFRSFADKAACTRAVIWTPEFQEDAAEVCTCFIYDETFSRLNALGGLTPEEWKDYKKNAALAALKGK